MFCSHLEHLERLWVKVEYANLLGSDDVCDGLEGRSVVSLVDRITFEFGGNFRARFLGAIVTLRTRFKRKIGPKIDFYKSCSNFNFKLQPISNHNNNASVRI